MSSDPDGPLSRTGVSQGTGGGEWVEDRKVLSGIIHVIQKGVAEWMPRRACGPHKALYNRCHRW